MLARMARLNTRRVVALLCLAGVGAVSSAAQLSKTAARVLGQPDFHQNGVNQAAGEELNLPLGLALDERAGSVRLYVADTVNNRVVGWRDAAAAADGQPAGIILGQPGPSHVAPMGIGPKGLRQPISIAVDPGSGDVYVVDFGNNRVVRFPQPLEGDLSAEPDAVYGQPDFFTFSPNSGGLGPNSLNGPRYAAFDEDGNLWVADSGNHRVLRFPAFTLDSADPAADLVLGQPDFEAAARNQGEQVSASGFDTPTAVTIGADGAVLVADFQNSRLLRFAPPLSSGQDASAVLGQPDFTSRSVPPQPTAWSMAGPAGICLSPDGSVNVAVPGDHRVLTFAADTVSQQPATAVLGQRDFGSALPNAGTFPLASARGLSQVNDVKVDRQGNVYVADAGNSRVLSFAPGAAAASRVFGQKDFSSNLPNRLGAGSLNAVFDVAIDYSREPFALYVSDTNNHRVLVWKDSTAFADGAPADLAIGQPDLETAHANIDTRGSVTPSRFTLSSPRGVAVDSEGRLFVADSGNNRVLSYPRPVDQPGRVEPDLVLGQGSFSSSSATPVTASKLRAPSGLAVTPNGRLFVADTGNNRVLEFDAEAGSGAAALRVFGKADFQNGSAPSATTAQSLSRPSGVYVDEAYSLYVADTGANRVVIYANVREAPESESSAAFVLGQSGFDVGEAGAGATELNAPWDVDVDSAGRIYVADNGNHRVLAYPPAFALPASGGAANEVLGQPALGARTPNFNSTDSRATAEGLFSPTGLLVDRQDTLYVGDTGNNRLVHFLKAAITVNAATFRSDQPVSPGSLASIFGGPFTDETAAASAIPLSTSLGGRVVEFENSRAPLLFLSPNQINLQVPSALSAERQRIRVRLAETGELIAGQSVVLSSTSPGLFVRDFDSQTGVVLNEDNSLNGPDNPAARGSVVQLFGTGQGPVNPAVADGAAGPTGPLARTRAQPTSDGSTCLNEQPSVCVAVGSVFGEILFSGLAPGFVGLWQINVRVPEGALRGDQVPVRAVIDGRPSNIVNIAIE